jgi:hypothetical protein
VQTQWRVALGPQAAHYQGLDYAAVYGHPSLARLDANAQAERLAQLQQIEIGALEGLNAS